MLVTTKKGRAGRSQVNFSAYQGVQSLTRNLDLLNAQQYNEVQREARINAGFDPDQELLPNGNRNPNFFPAIAADAPSTDWINEILRDNSRIQNYQLSTSSGNEKTQFYLSGGYFKQDAVLRVGDFERLSGRFNLTHQATKRLRVGTNIQLVKSTINQTAVDNSIFSPWPQALQSRPDEAPFNPDGSYAVVTTNNPLRLFEPQYRSDIYNALTNLTVEYEIIPGLSFKTLLGGEVNYTKDFTFLNTQSFEGGGAIGGEGTAADALRTNWITENTLNYNFTLVDNRLKINALAGFTYQEDTRERSSVTGRNFPSDALPYLTSAAEIVSGFSDWTQFGLESLLGRLNMDFDGKYLVSAAIRRDGSSRFGINNRYGVFPSVSVGWRLSSEPFMENLVFVNDLKVRASYGITGNQNSIGNFTATSQLSGGQNYDDQSGLGAVLLGNPDLKWETTAQTNLGLDVAVLNARLRFAFDYYDKLTDDLLLARPIPVTSGFLTINQNIGSVRNRGVELSVNSINIDRRVRWTTTLNVARNTNEVLSLFEDQPIQVGFVSRTAVGQPIGSFFVIRSLGVNPETGDMIYEDLDGDEVIGDADRQFLGNPIPNFEGGITNTLSFMGFDFSVFFQFSQGNTLYKLYEEGLNGTTNMGASLANMTTNVEDRWRQPGDVTDLPRAIIGAQGVQNNRRSSRFLEDGSYVRMKNITLGYSLPQAFVERARISSFRVYVTGQNLLTFTNYTGFDPEVFSSLDDRQGGVDQGAIPQLRNVSVGVNVGF